MIDADAQTMPERDLVFSSWYLLLMASFMMMLPCNHADGVQIAREHEHASVAALTGAALLILPGVVKPHAARIILFATRIHSCRVNPAVC